MFFIYAPVNSGDAEVEIKGCATTTMLTNCHAEVNNGRLLNIRKRIPKFDVL